MATLTGIIIADFTTTLASALSIGGTTATLSSATDDDGVALPTGRYFLTLDGSNSSKEHISCTLTGTALTNIKTVSRQGVETAGVLRVHRIGASVSITDFAHILQINNLINGTTDLNGADPLKYDADPTLSDDKHLATKKYVDDIAISGSPDATASVKGIGRVSVAPVSAATPIFVGDNDPRVPSQDEKNAIAGTSGTPSATNKFVTDSDPRISYIFGGTGADGDLHVTSGTTTLDLSSKTVYNYNNLTIDSGGVLTFTGGTSGTKVPVILVKGNFSNAGTITTVGKGLVGGVKGTGQITVLNNGVAGANGTQLFLDLTAPNGGGFGTKGGSSGGTLGSGGVKNATYFYPFNLNGASGGGGGGGGSMDTGSGQDGGDGGAGSLGLYIEIAGNFTNTGSINLNGGAGNNGTGATGNNYNSWGPGGGGGGGGGGAGSLIIKYRGTYTGGGTITTTGGAAGTGGLTTQLGVSGGSPSGNGCGGGGGGGGATYVNNGSNGINGATKTYGGDGKSGGDGGAGASGIAYLEKIQNLI